MKFVVLEGAKRLKDLYVTAFSAVLYTAACALSPSALLAQQQTIVVQAGVTVDHDTVTVGQVIRLTVRVRAPLGAIISFPTAADSLGAVQAIEAPIVHEGSDSATAADRVAIYQLAAWDVGKQTVKLGEVLVQSDAGDRRITLDLPTLFVASVLPQDSTLRVPKPPRPLIDVTATTPWWWWLIGAVVVAALVLLLWKWIDRRRRLAIAGDPYGEAIAAFQRIEKLKLADSGEPGRHAVLMVDVLRRYLSSRIEGVSLALTSSELTAALSTAKTITPEQVTPILSIVDPVKFARAPISGTDAIALGEQSKRTVRAEHDRRIALEAQERSTKERAA